MNQRELIGAIADKTGSTRKATTEMLNATLDVIQDAVTAGDKVSLPGFGTFERSFRKGGKRRNPGTGESIVVDDKQVPAFKPGSDFKAQVHTGGMKAAAKS